MLKKIIISIFLLFICNTYSMANPLPVFCLFGWLDDVSNEWSNACGKINNYIYEADYATDKNLKTYRLLGPYIYEADYATDKNLKTYRLLGPYIYEADYATDKNLKTYRLLGPYIYEADYATDKNLKTYRLH